MERACGKKFKNSLAAAARRATLSQERDTRYFAVCVRASPFQLARTLPMPRRANPAAAVTTAQVATHALPPLASTRVKKRKTAAPTLHEAPAQLPSHMQVVTAQGKREYQEDAFGFASTAHAHVFGIFDGHGGAQCSRFCATEVPAAVAAHKHLAQAPRRSLTEVFVDLDAKYCKTDREAGSTATVGVLQRVGNELKLTIASVGDSSCVLFFFVLGRLN